MEERTRRGVPYLVQDSGVVDPPFLWSPGFVRRRDASSQTSTAVATGKNNWGCQVAAQATVAQKKAFTELHIDDLKYEVNSAKTVRKVQKKKLTAAAKRAKGYRKLLSKLGSVKPVFGTEDWETAVSEVRKELATEMNNDDSLSPRIGKSEGSQVELPAGRARLAHPDMLTD